MCNDISNIIHHLYVRWVHLDTYCEWEWLSASAGSVRTGCNMDQVELAGNYSRFECGLTFLVQQSHHGEIF